MKAVGILERNCDLAELLAVVVRKLGLAVLDDDALERADVLLVDPMFSTQLERAEQLRAGGPSLPIICVCSEPLHPRALALRPSAFLRKPFGPAALEAAIAAALGRPAIPDS